MALTHNCYAVIEAGGTKFNCAIVDGHRRVLAEQRIATTTPGETLAQCVDFFAAQRQQGHHFARLGIASFGPLDLNPVSKTFGFITQTPKPFWSNTPLASHFEEALGVDVKIDTDVNAAALAEYRWGAAQGTQVSVYVTVGTGVGGGLVINGKPVHGAVHPEMGHMLVTPPQGQTGVCPFHENCVEGLASGTALGKIWGQPSDTFGSDHPAWDGLADVLAQFSHNILVTLSAEKIVFGGGVMQTPGLIERIVTRTNDYLKEYVVFPDGVAVDNILVLPGLEGQSGLFGALALLDETGA